MVRWWRLDGISAIGGGPTRRCVAPLTQEGEDSEMGGILIQISVQRASGSSPHILRSALASSSQAADAATDWTLSSKGVVAGAADSEEEATTEEARRITSSIGIRPAPDNDNNTQQPFLSRTNGVVGPNPPQPALSSSPLPLPPLRQQRGRPTLVALMATLPHMRVIIDVRSLLVR